MTRLLRSTCALLAILTLAACTYERAPYRGWHRGHHNGRYGWYDDHGGWRGDYYHHRF
ncbi:hypothetical protein HLH26_11165 [Gluconacetobacter sp. 1b LMG 1731]|uniref:Lipoprotein n=2 Tax=Gluconacetobacter TaxID=89583 RepID=A0A7W4ILH6_9PROT|nr:MULTISPECIES: hypothetical protein [Gluconacetobacter]GBQ96112.1 hypothetical protein AA0522_0718 [Gluconacetobacter liquefaciens NRIC 0522]MBB2165084.1 hypothetical protein [Gluconacetobacter dulcium]MBB2187929.1 hypothetical protein [Gluconacetobacter liquefaciens]MBB2194290.1 hypothetical protein [Gluconacetobacter dulcium]RDI36222.1 hypothetical protein C7453_1116 [Gluconacetobacter liquefaciens]